MQVCCSHRLIISACKVHVCILWRPLRFCKTNECKTNRLNLNFSGVLRDIFKRIIHNNIEYKLPPIFYAIKFFKLFLNIRFIVFLTAVIIVLNLSFLVT